MYKIILASASPRRKEILQQINVDFDVFVSDCEEVNSKTIPAEVVMELSEIKARDVYDKLQNQHDNLIVIGSDTVVASSNNILGKPQNRQDAYNMINEIQNNNHQVYTGVDIIVKISNYDNSTLQLVNESEEFELLENKDNILVAKANFAVSTDVHVYPMTEDEINAYIDSNEPYDKAGAYAIQGMFASNIEKINGDYYNVVGLPVSKLCNVLKTIGINIVS